MKLFYGVFHFLLHLSQLSHCLVVLKAIIQLQQENGNDVDVEVEWDDFIFCRFLLFWCDTSESSALSCQWHTNHEFHFSISLCVDFTLHYWEWVKFEKISIIFNFQCDTFKIRIKKKEGLLYIERKCDKNFRRNLRREIWNSIEFEMDDM